MDILGILIIIILMGLVTVLWDSQLLQIILDSITETWRAKKAKKLLTVNKEKS